jgi:hypothetical protein
MNVLALLRGGMALAHTRPKEGTAERMYALATSIVLMLIAASSTTQVSMPLFPLVSEGIAAQILLVGTDGGSPVYGVDVFE